MIKQLQNNFTTPEQSKRLLEIGLPADSADCFICTSAIGQDIGILDFPYSEIERECFLPCWSVGRLIEIYCIAKGITHTQISIYCLADIISQIEGNYEGLDFSKLKE